MKSAADLAPEARAYRLYAGEVLDRWASGLQEVIEDNPAMGGEGHAAEERRRFVVDTLAGRSRSLLLESAAPAVSPPSPMTAREVALALREDLLDALFPWAGTSPARTVLGPILAGHLRARLLQLTEVPEAALSSGAAGLPSSGVAAKLPLWPGDLLEEYRRRLDGLPAPITELVRDAPHAAGDRRASLLSRLVSLQAAIDVGDPRGLLSADATVSAILADLEAAQNEGFETDSGPVRGELARWGPELNALEERVRRFHESPLFGGRGAGTLTLIFLALSLTAGFLLRDRLAAVVFIALSAAVSAAVWLAFNGMSAALSRPYMDTLGRVRKLTLDLKAQQDPHTLTLARAAEIRRRLRW